MENFDRTETSFVGVEKMQEIESADMDKTFPEVRGDRSTASASASVGVAPLPEPSQAPVLPAEEQVSSTDEMPGDNEKTGVDFHAPPVVAESATQTAGIDDKKRIAARPEDSPDRSKKKIVPGELVLKSIDFKTKGNKFEAVIETNGAVDKYTAFSLQAPPRIVVDLEGVWKNKGEKEYEVKSGPVKKIRTGLYPDKLRVVLDIAGTELPVYQVEKSSRGLKLVAGTGG